MCHLEDFQRVNGLPVPLAGAGVPLLQMNQARVSVKLTQSSKHMRHFSGTAGPLFAPCMVCTARWLLPGFPLCLFSSGVAHRPAGRGFAFVHQRRRVDELRHGAANCT